MNIVILTPVYNDWDSLTGLLTEIDKVLSIEAIDLTVVVVNDASTQEPDTNILAGCTYRSINSIEVLSLNCNLGHQRAIAIGLADIVNRKQFDAVIIMDSDGEDRPVDLPKLITQYDNSHDSIVVARRDKRSEGILFKLGYSIYKIGFRLLTGHKISFGNYCLIPHDLLKRLIYIDTLWNHLAATILRSGLPLIMVSTIRGQRYKGEAKMNMVSLILLGLSAVSVYADIVLMRTLFASIILGLLTVGGIVSVMIIKFFTVLAIPGWASGVVGSLSIILVQSLVICIFVLFIVLANRSQRTFIPAKDYADYILNLRIISGHD